MTVTRSAISTTSSSRCETKTTAMPCALRRPTMASSRLTSVRVREAVGSSMNRSRALPARPRQIATIWRSAIDRLETGASSGRRKSRRSSVARAISRIRRRRTGRARPPRFSSIATFSATERLGKRERSWKMTWTPSSLARAGVRFSTGWPSNSIRPPGSGWWTPATSLIRVDLPQPFSPTRQCTSPGSTSQSTRSRAVTPVKRLVTPTRRSRGAGAAMGLAAPGEGRGGRGAALPPGGRLEAQLDQAVDRVLVDGLELLGEDQVLLRVHLDLAQLRQLHSVVGLLAVGHHGADPDDRLAGEHRVPDEALADGAGLDELRPLAGRERPDDGDRLGLAALLDGAGGADRPLRAEGEDALEVRMGAHLVERGPVAVVHALRDAEAV